MLVYRAIDLRDACDFKVRRPDAVMIHGGTDIMVDLNFDRRRPSSLLDLTEVPELRVRTSGEGYVDIGAGVTLSEIIAAFSADAPGLAMSCRTIGSPQIRNRATLGGNLGTSSPAGDALPPLLAAEAVLRIASARGVRFVPVSEFFVGAKRNCLEQDELIESVRVPLRHGPEHFAKVGARNAMVIAIASFAIAMDPVERRIRTGLGAVAPTPIRAIAAESYAERRVDWQSFGIEPLPKELLEEFGNLVMASANPIDDLRGPATYRRHVIGVMARRALGWAWLNPGRDEQCA